MQEMTLLVNIVGGAEPDTFDENVRLAWREPLRTRRIMGRQRYGALARMAAAALVVGGCLACAGPRMLPPAELAQGAVVVKAGSVRSNFKPLSLKGYALRDLSFESEWTLDLVFRLEDVLGKRIPVTLAAVLAEAPPGPAPRPSHYRGLGAGVRRRGSAK
jgi:hypothetical protein